LDPRKSIHQINKSILRAWNSLGREGAFYAAALLFGAILVVLGVWYGIYVALVIIGAGSFIEWRVQVYISKQQLIERELREMLDR
jgi:uncharacterized protein (DUF58 family)